MIEYLNEYDNITRDATFWMYPRLLQFLNDHEFETNDEFIAGILNDSIAAIQRYLVDYEENRNYIEGLEVVHDEIPNDVVNIIFDFENYFSPMKFR